jgi:hypothetical protein
MLTMMYGFKFWAMYTYLPTILVSVIYPEYWTFILVTIPNIANLL